MWCSYLLHCNKDLHPKNHAWWQKLLYHAYSWHKVICIVIRISILSNMKAGSDNAYVDYYVQRFAKENGRNLMKEM